MAEWTLHDEMNSSQMPCFNCLFLCVFYYIYLLYYIVEVYTPLPY